MTAKSVSMNDLAGILSDALRVPVADQTGIAGRFDASLRYTPDPSDQPLTTKSGEPLPPPSPEAANGPSIFGALQDLGLKLESAPHAGGGHRD